MLKAPLDIQSTSIIEKKGPMATLIQVPMVIYFSENSHAYDN